MLMKNKNEQPGRFEENKLWLDQRPIFVNKILWKHATPFIYVLSMAGFALQQQR